MLHPHVQWRAYAALAAVCFFWGTTYLGIRMALESFSPVQLVAIRFTTSGVLLLIATKFAKARLPSGRELWFAVVIGLLILGVGNSCLAFAEDLIPSGLAALFVTISPFWMMGFDALVPGGERLHRPTIVGMMVGLAGTVLLVGPSAARNGVGGPVLTGFLILQLGSSAWSFGSILQRRYPTRAHPIVSGAVQQLSAGVLYVLPALFLPSAPVRWTGRGVGAVLYLVVFGSIVGYSAYLYSLEHLPVSVVSIYNYMNPIVAVFLGWLFYRESFGARELFAMCIIFVGVAIVKRYGHRPATNQTAKAS